VQEQQKERCEMNWLEKIRAQSPCGEELDNNGHCGYCDGDND
jgi:hypothetical protein